MAKIYLVHGTKQLGMPLLNLPWAQCVELLEIDEDTRTEERSKFGETHDPYSPTNVVVRLENEEASQVGIDPGFFDSPLSPDIAQEKLKPFLLL